MDNFDDILKIIFVVIVGGLFWISNLIKKNDSSEDTGNVNRGGNSGRKYDEEQSRKRILEQRKILQKHEEDRAQEESESLAMRRNIVNSTELEDAANTQKDIFAGAEIEDEKYDGEYFDDVEEGESEFERVQNVLARVSQLAESNSSLERKKVGKPVRNILVEEAEAQRFSLSDMNLNSPEDLAKAFLASEILDRPLSLRNEFRELPNNR